MEDSNVISLEVAEKRFKQIKDKNTAFPKESDAVDYTPITPIPIDAPPFLEDLCLKGLKHKFSDPKAVYTYRNEDGNPLCHILRFEKPGTPKGEKEFYPLTYGVDKKGENSWHLKNLIGLRPLYNLHLLSQNPDKPVIVYEGEKKADASSILFPDYLATSPMNGAQSPGKTDWSALKDRTVILSIDNDDPGKAFGDKVCAFCREAGAKEVLYLAPEKLGLSVIQSNSRVSREKVPHKYDLADALAEGWTSDLCQKMIEEDPSFFVPYQFFNVNPPQSIQEFKDRLEKTISAVDRFRLTDDCVEVLENSLNPLTGEETSKWVKMCSWVKVDAFTRDVSGNNWGRLLSIRDSDGNHKQFIIPVDLMAGDGNDLRKILLSRGVIFEPRCSKKNLEAYFNLDPCERAICVETLGWHENVYIRPDKIYGDQKEEKIVFQGRVLGNVDLQQGTLKEWQENIGRYIEGNSVLYASACMALVGPILRLMNEENLVLHFFGASTIGKSTALKVACSVAGTSCGSWRTTDNAAESLAKNANDGLLVLDELGEVDARSADNMAYMLGNGYGKARASKLGEAKPIAKFRLAALSSGEIGLSHKLSYLGKGLQAGQAVRFIEIPADAGKGDGIFDQIHGFRSSKDLAVYLNTITSQFTGSVLNEWLRILSDPETVSGALQLLKTLRDQWLQSYVGVNVDGQVSRCARKFALLAAVGELAGRLGLFPRFSEDNHTSLSLGEGSRCIHDLYQRWLSQRGGGEDSQELNEVIKRLNRFLQEHGSSRFENAWSACDEEKEIPVDQKVLNRAGFRRLQCEQWQYFFHKEIFEKEIIQGPSLNLIPQLVKKGVLLSSADSRSSHSVRVPGYGQQRLLKISSVFFTNLK